MALFKCTMLLTLATNTSGTSLGRRIAGWSESVYDTPTSPTKMRTDFEDLCQRRARMLPDGAAVVGQRYQAVDPVGGATTGKRVYPGAQGPCDVPQMAALITIPASNTPNIRRFILRGVPDANVIEGEYKPTPAFTLAVNGFANGLVGYQFRARNIELDEIPIVSISDAGVFVLGADLTFVKNDLLRVFKTKETSFDTTLSGLFRASARVDAQNGTFATWTHGARVGGSVRREGIIYPTLGSIPVVDVSITQRKAGRPLNQYRGRASARA